MTLVTGRLRGRRFFAWWHHRRQWQWQALYASNDRITESGASRLTELGSTRITES